jgi:hypothetical protein
MAQKAQEDLANMPPLIINGKLQFGDLTNPLATIRPGFNNQQASSAPLIGTLNINGQRTRHRQRIRSPTRCGVQRTF